jgi:two-component system chemotaxis sensor kinase CheA
MSVRSLLRVIDIDRLIPTRLREGDQETLRKARIAIYFALALLAQCAVYIPTYAYEGFPALSVFISMGALLLCFLPLTLRLKDPLAWTGLYISALVFGVLASTAYYTGGVHSTSLWWMCMVPIAAMLVSGKRLAVAMGALHVAIVVAFYAADRAGEPWPVGLEPARRPDILLQDIPLLMLTLVALAWIFERAKERAMSALAGHNQELRLILDNVGQGFLCCDDKGALIGRRSAITEVWFGQPGMDERLWSYLGRSDGSFRERLEVGWSALTDGVLPIELCLNQLPSRFASGAHTFHVEYRPLMAGESLSQVVVVVTEITAVVEGERAETEQRELATALDHAVRDRTGFLQFIKEGVKLARQLDMTNPALKRVLHTLKANCGFYGVRSVASMCHELEGELEKGRLVPSSLDALERLWSEFCDRVGRVLETRAGTIEISIDDYTALRSAVRTAASHAALDRMVAELRYDSMKTALGRAAEHARSLARRLERGEVLVEVEAVDVRLDPQRWKSFWSSFVHAIRNAVDHGLEDPEDRLAAGKAPQGRVRLAAAFEGTELVISIQDDGRGVDWHRVAERARAANLAHASLAELEEALFSDGFSTRTEATDVSGRGIGLGALRAAVSELGGHIQLRSRSGEGTTVLCRFPSESRWSRPPARNAA